MTAVALIFFLFGAAAASCFFLPAFDVLSALGLSVLAGNIFVLGCAGLYALQNRE